jgi:hypothetical protein
MALRRKKSFFKADERNFASGENEELGGISLQLCAFA